MDREEHGDPVSDHDPATTAGAVTAGIAALASLGHRLLDVGGARKKIVEIVHRLDVADGVVAALRTDLDALATRVHRKLEERRASTGSFPRATELPPAPVQPAVEQHALDELRARLARIEAWRDSSMADDKRIEIMVTKLAGQIETINEIMKFLRGGRDRGSSG